MRLLTIKKLGVEARRHIDKDCLTVMFKNLSQANAIIAKPTPTLALLCML